ncbi:MAG: NAD-dependent epimerase/dehydratase family protein [Rhodocyclaceae bacterium]|nr:NAD-dependent epimerase/dehydratase family protein [Rhodocyclaceae bacterium]
MHVLVTGGAGFIGSHSVDRLLETGARVRVLDNFSSGKPENLEPHPFLEVVAGDIRDREAVAQAMSGISHVLHLAAQVSVAASMEDPLGSAEVNISGFLNVLDSARREGVRRFVYASSAAVYGMPARLHIHEEDPALPISPYGLEKSVNDQYAHLYREIYGFSCLGQRYFNVFGPRQDPSSPYSGVISIFARSLREGRPLTVHGDGLQTRDFIYVGDVAAANVLALNSEQGGVCNVATGQEVTLLQMVDDLAAVAGVQADIRFGPGRAGDIRHSSADNHRLTQDIGLKRFTSLRDGLARLWACGG